VRPGAAGRGAVPGRPATGWARAARAAVLAAGLLAAVAGGARADSARGILEEGNRLFERGRFEDALAAYREGLLQHPDVPELHLGAGNALYRLKRFPEAAQEFQEASRARLRGVRAAGNYNQGDALVRGNQLPQSLESFKEALRQHPDDPDAKFNYELIRARMEEEKQSQQKQPSGGGAPKQKQPDKGGERPKPQPGGDSGQKQSRALKDPQQMSREQAEQILKALASDEQRLQNERLKARVTQQQPEKDW